MHKSLVPVLAALMLVSAPFASQAEEDPNLPWTAMFVPEHCPDIAVNAAPEFSEYWVNNKCNIVSMPIHQVYQVKDLKPAPGWSCPSTSNELGATLVIENRRDLENSLLQTIYNRSRPLPAFTLVSFAIDNAQVTRNSPMVIEDRRAIDNIDQRLVDLTGKGACELVREGGSSARDIRPEMLKGLIGRDYELTVHDTASKPTKVKRSYSFEILPFEL